MNSSPPSFFLPEKGKQTYDLYVEWVDGVSFNGEKLKDFVELPSKNQTAWIMSSNNIKKPKYKDE